MGWGIAYEFFSRNLALASVRFDTFVQAEDSPFSLSVYVHRVTRAEEKPSFLKKKVLGL